LFVFILKLFLQSILYFGTWKRSIILLFSDVMPCSVVEIYQRFGVSW